MTKKIKGSFCLACLLVLAFSRLQGQDFKADLKRMNDFYRNTTVFSADIKVDIYQPGTSAPHVENASLRKKGQMYYYHFQDIKMLINEKCLLVIDEGEKDIMYRELKKGEVEDLISGFVTPDLDSVLTLYDSVKYMGISENLRHYVIYTAGQMIVRTDLMLDSSSGAISKIRYYYNEKHFPGNQQVVINFNNRLTLSEDSDDLFSEKKYIRRQGKEIKPAGAYASYQLIISEDHEDF